MLLHLYVLLPQGQLIHNSVINDSRRKNTVLYTVLENILIRTQCTYSYMYAYNVQYSSIASLSTRGSVRSSSIETLINFIGQYYGR